MPIALIDLLGETRVWLKSAQGVDLIEAPRETSYCQYAVLHSAVCYVEDTLKDPRLFDNPHAENFRFYAGHPLRFDGQNVGVLCVCDYVPRSLTSDQLDTLRELAENVERELQMAKMSEVQIAMAERTAYLERKVNVDTLTRIWNRGAILDILEREIGQSNGALSTIMLDVDFFKKVNDAYGHAGGDAVLRTVSEVLRGQVRVMDAAGRVGGEEFLLVCPDTRLAEATAIADRIRARLSASLTPYDHHAIPVTASFGVATYERGETVEQLIRRADLKLYEAKRNGRNRVAS